MKKAKLIQAFFTQEEIAAINTKNIKLEEENKKLKKENKKLKDKFMLRLAETYLLPPTSNQMAEYKQWNYSKWYDEVQNQIMVKNKGEK